MSEKTSDTFAKFLHWLSEIFSAMPNEFWAAIVGAIVGAVVGGIIAYLIQLKALNADAKQRENDTKESRKVLGYALLFKMISIYSSLKHNNLYLTKCLDELKKEENAGRDEWQVVIPIANLGENINFSVDEMAMLLSLKEDDLFNDMVSFDKVHNSILDLFRMYTKLRMDLSELFPPKMSEGLVGEVHLPKDQARMFQFKAAEVNSLIVSIIEKCNVEEKRAWDVLERLGDTLNSKLDLAVSVSSKQDIEV